MSNIKKSDIDEPASNRPDSSKSETDKPDVNIPRAKIITDALGLDGDTKHISELYRKWSSTYDQDTAAENYSGPARIAQLVHLYWSDRHANTNAEILDAGCGTGLVGLQLAKLNYTQLTGIDISQSMVDQAKLTKSYQQLHAPVDLNCAINKQIPNALFDVTVCCGVFTLGHVPPESLIHLINATRSGGYVITSARAEYCEQFPFEATCQSLQDDGKIIIEHAASEAYLNYDQALYSVMRVQ